MPPLTQPKATDLIGIPGVDFAPGSATQNGIWVYYTVGSDDNGLPIRKHLRYRTTEEASRVAELIGREPSRH